MVVCGVSLEDDLLLLVLFLFEFTFYEADKKYKNRINDQRSNCNRHIALLIFVVSMCVVRAEIEQPQRRAS